MLKYLCLSSISFLSFQTQIFSNQLFEFAKNFLPENPVIIDCGCYDGGDSISMAQFWPKGHVYAFEAVPLIYNQTKKLELYFPNIHVFPFALGDFDQKTKFYISEEEAKPGVPSLSSSLLPPKEHLDKAPGIKFPTCIDVDMTKLDTWAEKHGIDHVDFLWLDMQGYELNMIKASQLAQKAKVIWTEVIWCEAYENQSQYSDVMEWMLDHDFVFMGSDINHHDDNQWFGNVLFVHKTALNK